jgi:cell wall-associated NlpC family hydrolase
MSDNLDIVAEARTWIGVPWAHQGRSRDGVDCAGLVIEVAKAVRGSTFDKTDYPRMATDETMLELCAQHLGPVSRDRMQPGDLAVFAFDRQRHVAILGDYVFGGLSLIHAYALAPRRVVETRLDDKWRGRMLAAWRFPRELA